MAAKECAGSACAKAGAADLEPSFAQAEEAVEFEDGRWSSGIERAGEAKAGRENG